jgi:hypothetical protein
MLGGMIRRSGVPVAVALTAALLLAGCGGGGGAGAAKPTGSDRPSSQPTQGGTELAAVWPLTGLPAPATTPKHPVMVVKIDNTYASEPQVGLGSADMVVEELVEGGITRLATLFYSKLPATVGPVRSMRASDIGVVRPTQGVLVASGGATVTRVRLRQAGVVYFTEGSVGSFRDHSRHAPYNLFVHLPELGAKLAKRAKVPANYLPWGNQKDFVGVSPAKRISVKFSPATTTNFLYSMNAGKYINTNTHASAKDQFKADSVLVLRVREGDAGYHDPAGNPVPEALFYGGGGLLLFHHGQVVRGHWTKAGRTAPLVLKTAAGPLKVPAGHVWIELVPEAGPLNSAGVVSFR